MNRATSKNHPISRRQVFSSLCFGTILTFPLAQEKKVKVPKSTKKQIKKWLEDNYSKKVLVVEKEGLKGLAFSPRMILSGPYGSPPTFEIADSRIRRMYGEYTHDIPPKTKLRISGAPTGFFSGVAVHDDRIGLECLTLDAFPHEFEERTRSQTYKRKEDVQLKLSFEFYLPKEVIANADLGTIKRVIEEWISVRAEAGGPHS